MKKRAVITGITGQDGSYLAELLLDEGLRSHSASSAVRARRISGASSTCSTASQLRPGDLLDQLSIIRIIESVKPHEFYNLAAMSFVPASWDQPMLTGEFNAQGVTRVLEAIRQVDPSIRLYQASSSEMFGKVREVPQTELTPVLSAQSVRRLEGLRRTTSRSTTVRATASLPVRASCSTTSRRGAAWSS